MKNIDTDTGHKLHWDMQINEALLPSNSGQPQLTIQTIVTTPCNTFSPKSIESDCMNPPLKITGVTKDNITYF